MSACHATKSQRGSDVRVTEIRLKKGEPVEKALRRLKKRIDREGILKEVRNHRHFEKPSEKRRRKMKIARWRAGKYWRLAISANRSDSRAITAAAGSPATAIHESGSGSIQETSLTTCVGGRSPSHDGASPDGNTRGRRDCSAVKHTLEAIL